MAPKVAIVIYTLYGHIAKLAEAEKQGIEEAGGSAQIFQIAETLPEDVLTKMYAPPKPAYPLFTTEKLTEFDAILYGIPTRFGNMPAQWKTFWDATGKLWGAGDLEGKYAGVFTSTATAAGGQEMTVVSLITTLAHHGMIFVAPGYGESFPYIANLTEAHGGGPLGAGTFAAPDGSRQPSEVELTIAKLQGKKFYNTVNRVRF